MTSFQDMLLPVELQKALKSLNFTTPTEIQASTIPLASEGKDFMACAETGSGKTAAYAIPTIVSLLADKEKHALILAPTRELAQQIADVFRDLTKFSDGLSVTALIGGADIHTQFRSLKKNPRILVATPGRLTDHLYRKSVILNSTGILVLDEGDRMLDMGFAPQLDEILKFLPKKRQTSLFTATLPDKVKKLAEKYLSNPEQINVGRISLPVATITQSVIEVMSKEKEDRLVDELNKRQNSVIIFAKTKIKTDKLAHVLKDYGFAVDLIHGGRSQGQRNKAIANFKNGKSRILVATDVAARGIDIPQVAHVINYDLPMMIEDYVHRIGRTARNGASGEAVSFVTPDEHRTWNMIVKKYKIVNVELKNKSARGGGSDDDRRSRGPRSGSGDRRRSSFGGRSGGERSERSGGFSGERSARSSEERSSGFRSESSEKRQGFRTSEDGGSERREFSSFKKKPFARAGEEGGFRKFDRPKFDGPRTERAEGDSSERSERPSYPRKPKFESRFQARTEDGANGFKSERSKDWGSGEKREFKRDFKSDERSNDSKPFGRKPFGERKFGADRSEDKTFGEKKFRPERSAERSEGGFGEKKFGERKFGEKKFSTPRFADSKFGEKKFGEKKFGASSEGEKSSESRFTGQYDDRKVGGKKYSSKKVGEKKFGGFKKSSGPFSGSKRSEGGSSKSFSKSF